MAKCQGMTKSGSRCKRNVAEGADYCSSHGPDKASRARSNKKDGSNKESGSSKRDRQSDPASPGGRSGASSRERHINSGEDLLHLAIGVAVTVAMFWLLKRGPRLPGM